MHTAKIRRLRDSTESFCSMLSFNYFLDKIENAKTVEFNLIEVNTANTVQGVACAGEVACDPYLIVVLNGNLCLFELSYREVKELRNSDDRGIAISYDLIFETLRVIEDWRDNH